MELSSDEESEEEVYDDDDGNNGRMPIFFFNFNFIHDSLFIFSLEIIYGNIWVNI